MVTIHEPGREERPELLIDEDEDHDGWGPIRPRRSSMAPVMRATDDDRDTRPALCTPHPEGSTDKR